MKDPEILKAEQLKSYIFGDPANPHANFQFYYQGSSMRQAQRMNSIAAGATNVKPIPFIIPPAQLSDPYYLRNANSSMLEAKWKEYTEIPTYIIEDYNYWGGHLNFENNNISWKEFSAEIFIGNCTFLQPLAVRFIKLKYSLNFSNCIFNNETTINNIGAKELTFSNCNFNNNSVIISNSNIKSIKFIKCKNIDLSININARSQYAFPNDYKLIDDIDYTVKSVTFLENEINKLSISGEMINTVVFEKSKFEEINIDLDISNSKIINKDLEKLKIKNFDALIKEREEKHSTNIENFHIENFSLTGNTNNSTFTFAALLIDSIKIHYLNNEGKIRFYDIRLNVGGSLEILSSQMGKSEFNSVDFSLSSSAKIYLSNITEVITHNTIFPNNITSKDNSNLMDVREVYRQLKNAASKQSDRVSELRYEQREMSLFKEILTNNSDNNYDIWILKLNEWSNGHGQNWAKAGRKLLFYSLISFSLIRLLLGYTYFDISLIFSNLADYLTFTINPLHKFSEVFNETSNVPLNGLAKTTDVLSKLFSGYMIFQFLRAFRKYYK